LRRQRLLPWVAGSSPAMTTFFCGPAIFIKS
jgi:hypothetical protein